MSRFSERFETFSREWNDLPRRAVMVLALSAGVLLAVFLFRYVAPFVIAALLALASARPVRWLTRLFGGGKKRRAFAAAITVTLFSGIVLALVLFVAIRLAAEIRALIAALPVLLESAARLVSGWIAALGLERLGTRLTDVFGALGAQAAALAAQLASGAASAALKTVSSLPSATLFLVVTVAGAYYFSAEPERIRARLNIIVPQRLRMQMERLGDGVVRCVVCQVRAAAVMLLINFILLSLGLTLLGQEYALAIAGGVALLDALPVVGAGLFLLPAGAYQVFGGAWLRGAGFALLYLALIAARQLMEPRLIGRQLGLHPLSTMAAMYAGLKAVGAAGLLLGPLLLLICKVVLAPEEGQQAVRPVQPVFARRKSPGGSR